MFSDDEIKSIVLAVLRDRAEEVTESSVGDDIERALDWGSKVRAQSLLLELVFSGKVNISVTPVGEIRFTRAAEVPETFRTLPW